jgi:hypothetical protein
MTASKAANGSERKFQRPGLCVHIAAHREHRRNEFEFRENFGRAHVSGVNDELHSKQGVMGFGSKEAVGIGNNADPHGGRMSV